MRFEIRASMDKEAIRTFPGVLGLNTEHQRIPYRYMNMPFTVELICHREGQPFTEIRLYCLLRIGGSFHHHHRRIQERPYFPSSRHLSPQFNLFTFNFSRHDSVSLYFSHFFNHLRPAIQHIITRISPTLENSTTLQKWVTKVFSQL